MTKTVYEKGLEEQSQATLVYMCEGKRLLHTGDKQSLVAHLVEAKQVESKTETEAEPAPAPVKWPSFHRSS